MYFQKVSRLKLYLPKQKWTMNEMLIFFKRVSLTYSYEFFTCPSTFEIPLLSLSIYLSISAFPKVFLAHLIHPVFFFYLLFLLHFPLYPSLFSLSLYNLFPFSLPFFFLSSNFILLPHSPKTNRYSENCLITLLSLTTF